MCARSRAPGSTTWSTGGRAEACRRCAGPAVHRRHDLCRDHRAIIWCCRVGARWRSLAAAGGTGPRCGSACWRWRGSLACGWGTTSMDGGSIRAQPKTGADRKRAVAPAGKAPGRSGGGFRPRCARLFKGRGFGPIRDRGMNCLRRQACPIVCRARRAIASRYEKEAVLLAARRSDGPRARRLQARQPMEPGCTCCGGLRIVDRGTRVLTDR